MHPLPVPPSIYIPFLPFLHQLWAGALPSARPSRRHCRKSHPQMPPVAQSSAALPRLHVHLLLLYRAQSLVAACVALRSSATRPDWRSLVRVRKRLQVLCVDGPLVRLRRPRKASRYACMHLFDAMVLNCRRRLLLWMTMIRPTSSQLLSCTPLESRRHVYLLS